MEKRDRPIVGHVNASFFGGSQTFIYNYITSLRDFHPILLARRFENLDQFPVPPEDSYTISFKRYSPRWLYYTALRKLSGRDTLLTKVLRMRKTSLIHAHFGLNGYYSLHTAEELDIPLVTNFYGFDLSIEKYLDKVKGEYGRLFAGGDLFLVEGPHMKSRLQGIGCPEEKIGIQRIAVPIDAMRYRPRKPGRGEEKAVFVCAGRFVEKKGFIYALKAVKEAHKHFGDLELRIIGDGPLRKEIEDFIAANNMETYVELKGFLRYESYLEEMQEADIFIQPSVTASDGDSEGGAPTTLLEAQAMGMPVLAFEHADIPYVVMPGRSALLCTEGDWRALRENMGHLLENRDEWEKMGECGRDFVRERHDVAKEVVALENRYHELCD